MCIVGEHRVQGQGAQGQGARVPACLTVAQAWLMALSPMSGQLSACFQIKNAYSLGCQVSDPRTNTKPSTQVGKLRPVAARRGQAQFPLSIFPGQGKGGWSVCSSTHPSSSHFQPPTPLNAPWSWSPATPFQGM